MVGHHRCACESCTNRSRTTISFNISFFRFPREKKRCLKWILNAGIESLLVEWRKNPLYPYRIKRLCSAHFEDSQFIDWMRNRLRLDAVPTLFGPLAASYRRDEPKRIKKEKLGDELVIHIKGEVEDTEVDETDQVNLGEEARNGISLTHNILGVTPNKITDPVRKLKIAILGKCSSILGISSPLGQRENTRANGVLFRCKKRKNLVSVNPTAISDAAYPSPSNSLSHSKYISENILTQPPRGTHGPLIEGPKPLQLTKYNKRPSKVKKIKAVRKKETLDETLNKTDFMNRLEVYEAESAINEEICIKMDSSTVSSITVRVTKETEPVILSKVSAHISSIDYMQGMSDLQHKNRFKECSVLPVSKRERGTEFSPVMKAEAYVINPLHSSVDNVKFEIYSFLHTDNPKLSSSHQQQIMAIPLAAPNTAQLTRLPMVPNSVIDCNSEMNKLRILYPSLINAGPDVEQLTDCVTSSTTASISLQEPNIRSWTKSPHEKCTENMLPAPNTAQLTRLPMVPNSVIDCNSEMNKLRILYPSLINAGPDVEQLTDCVTSPTTASISLQEPNIRSWTKSPHEKCTENMLPSSNKCSCNKSECDHFVSYGEERAENYLLKRKMEDIELKMKYFQELFMKLKSREISIDDVDIT